MYSRPSSRGKWRARSYRVAVATSHRFQIIKAPRYRKLAWIHISNGAEEPREFGVETERIREREIDAHAPVVAAGAEQHVAGLDKGRADHSRGGTDTENGPVLFVNACNHRIGGDRMLDHGVASGWE